MAGRILPIYGFLAITSTVSFPRVEKLIFHETKKNKTRLLDEQRVNRTIRFSQGITLKVIGRMTREKSRESVTIDGRREFDVTLPALNDL